MEEQGAVWRRATSANEHQEGGDHYMRQKIQPWDFIIANKLGYLEGNVIKYVTRHKLKNRVEDLKKARHYLDKLIETEERERNGLSTTK